MKKFFERLFIRFTQLLPLEWSLRMEQWMAMRKGGEHTRKIDIRGNSKKPIRYVVYEFDAGWGLFAAANLWPSRVAYSRKKGALPLVYMECAVPQQFDPAFGRNFWADVFEMPVSVQDALKDSSARTVLKFGGRLQNDYHFLQVMNGDGLDYTIHILTNNWREYYSRWHEATADTWIFRKDLLSWCQNYYENNLKGHVAIGVMMREQFSREWFDAVSSDQVKDIFRSHPSGPNVDEVIDLVRDFAQKNKADTIFLATQYVDTIRTFREKLPSCRICLIERKRKTISEDIAQAKEFVEDKKRLSTEDEREQIVSYAKEVILLSKCNYFVAPHCSGTAAALVLNGGRYDDIKILEDFHHNAAY